MLAQAPMTVGVNDILCVSPVCVCFYIPLGAAQCFINSLSYCCHPPVSLLLEFSALAVIFVRKNLPKLPDSTAYFESVNVSR